MFYVAATTLNFKRNHFLLNFRIFADYGRNNVFVRELVRAAQV